MTDVKIVSGVADTDDPFHVLVTRPEGNPHLERALEKWRQQVEQDTDKTISAFASSL